LNKLFENKVLLITGATGGLANEFIKNIKSNGTKLILLAKNKNKLNKLLKNFKNADAHVCDFEKTSEIEKTIKKIKNKENKIDYVFNFAGYFSYLPINKISPAEYNKSFNINCYAPIIINSTFIQIMKKNNFGRIINIGSSSSYNGFENTSLYCASKHALLGFSRAMKDENKSKKIKIYDILPGSIKTKMGKKVKNQVYNDFLEPNAICNLINNLISDNSNLVVDEIKIKRKI